jgi:hypothetical protein
MGAISKNVVEDLLNYIFNAGAYTPATNLYLSLHTAGPGDDGTNEVTYTGYTGAIRPAIVFTTAAASRAILHDNTLLTFPMSLAISQTATHYGIWSSATVGAGTFLGGGSLESNLFIAPGNTPKVDGAVIQISWEAGSSVGMVTSLANKLLDFVFRNTAYTVPVIELALYTTTSTDAVPGTECVGANYSRILVPNWDAAAIDTLDVYLSNTGTDSFASPSDDSWLTVVSLGVLDNTTGDMLFYGNDIDDILILAGIAIRADPNQVEIRLA